MCAKAPSGAQGSPATTGPDTSGGEGGEGGTGTNGTRADGTMLGLTTIDGTSPRKTLDESGKTGLADRAGARDGVEARSGRWPAVSRLAVVGAGAEVPGGTGGSAYRLVAPGGSGVAGGAASWSTAPPEPLARPKVSHPISPTSSA